MEVLKRSVNSRIGSPGYNFDAGLQVVKQLNLNTMRTFVVVVCAQPACRC